MERHARYLKSRGKALKYAKDYYAKNKEKIKEWKKEYRKHNLEKVRAYRRSYKQKDSFYWEMGRTKDAPTKAENLVREKILPSLGFTDIYKPTSNFYFDGFAKKGDRIYVIEVSTSKQKTMPRHRTEFIKYFGYKLITFHVKPDLSEYWVVYPKNQSSHYKQGRRFKV